MGKQEVDLEGRRNGGQKDLADLSAIDILVASFKLMRNHTKLFLLIMISMVLPVSVIETGFSVLMFSLAFGSQIPPAGISALTGGLPRTTSRTFETSNNQDTGGVSDFPYLMLVTFGLNMANTLMASLLIPVAFSPLAYAVACIFKNVSVKLSDTVAAMRTCWSRALLTSLCVYTIYIASSLITLANNLFINYVIKSGYAKPGWIIVFAIVAIVSLLVSLATIIATFMFDLSLPVATLEEVLGWKAMGKAWWLLRSKLRVALGVKGLILLMLLPTTAFAFWWTSGGTASSKISSKQAWLSLATGITPTWVLCFVLWGTVMTTIQILMTSVLYLSCKAKRGDSLEEVKLFKIDSTEKLYTKVATVESEAE